MHRGGRLRKLRHDLIYDLVWGKVAPISLNM
jgi:hypothetical protein